MEIAALGPSCPPPSLPGVETLGTASLTPKAPSEVEEEQCLLFCGICLFDGRLGGQEWSRSVHPLFGGAKTEARKIAPEGSMPFTFTGGLSKTPTFHKYYFIINRDSERLIKQPKVT